LTNKISKNPQLKKGTQQYKTYLSLLSNKAPDALENAELIKRKLDEEIKNYEKYDKIRQEQQEQQRQEEEQQEHQRQQPLETVHDEPEDNNIAQVDFDEEKFANKLKQFQKFQNKNINQSINSYPILEHISPSPQALSKPETPIPQLAQHIPLSTAPPPYESIPPIPPKKALSPPPSLIPQPQHKSISQTESNKPLKTVFLPSKLPLQFLQISSQNSQNNLETCGILCGSLSLNAFFITTLLIPSQESTPNTCQTLHEEDIFEYIDSKDLFVLGWIHTHPSQSCFLSSVDLHTQNSYQIMLPEALAIVCAVKHGEVGQFRLTDPPGIGIITKCQKSGFHPHEESGIYKHCESKFGGHVVVKDGLPFDVVDLRKK